jgi:hypothetical protein
MINLNCTYPLLSNFDVAKDGIRVLKMMSETYVQAIVTPLTEADTARVNSWFENRGFSLQLMQGGQLLLSGTGSQFADTFRIPEAEIDARLKRDIKLDVPFDLNGSADSIVIRRVPSTHGE